MLNISLHATACMQKNEHFLVEWTESLLMMMVTKYNGFRYSKWNFWISNPFDASLPHLMNHLDLFTTQHYITLHHSVKIEMHSSHNELFWKFKDLVSTIFRPFKLFLA